MCVRLRYTPRERSTERAFIPSLLFFFSFLSAHLVALSYSSRPVHARARVVVVVGGVLCGVREVLFSDCCVVHSLRCFCVFYEGSKKVFESFPGRKKEEERESESERLLSSILFVFFFLGLSTSSKDTNRMATFLYYSSITPLLKKRQKRPTNPTIFSASLTSPASPRGSSSVGR